MSKSVFCKLVHTSTYILIFCNIVSLTTYTLAPVHLY